MGIWGYGRCIALAAFCFLTSGCQRAPAPHYSPPTTHQPTRGGTLRLAVKTDVQSLDPAIAYDTFSWPLVRMLYHGLLDYDDEVNLIPWLAAEMPTISPDGRTYTFRLKKGVRFSNGRELVAEDFVFTFERILDPQTKSPGESFFRHIVGARAFQKAREKEAELAKGDERKRERRWIEPTRVAGLRALDRYTLQIQLEQPDLAFLNVMAMPFSFAVPQEAVQQHKQEFFRHPVGTGPFVLAEWIRGMRLRFERNPFYNAWLIGTEVKLDAVEVMVGGDDLIHQMMFERGELEIMDEIPAPDFVRIMNDPKWKPSVASMPVNATIYIALNCEMKPFTDVRVRQAMNYAVDKDRILKIINGRGVSARGVLPPLMPGYSAQLKGYPYNPEKAKQLLARAGYPNGFSVPLWVSVDRNERVKMAEAVQQDLAKVGVKVELKPVAFAVWDEAVSRRKNVPFAFSGWYQDYPDPSNFLDVLLSGDRIVDVHCNNLAFYSNPQVNKLLRAAAKETNRAQRLRLYQQAEQLIVRDAPWVFLYHPTLYMLVQPYVKGHTMHPVWPNRYERLWLEKRN